MRVFVLWCLLLAVAAGSARAEQQTPVGARTQECISCHSMATPGIVADWLRSRHAGTTPKAAVRKPAVSRKVSAASIPDELRDTAVGCAECHTLNPPLHADTFEHNGYPVHTVVTPRDCATCHPVETQQFGKNLMSHAYGNLMRNPLFRSLSRSINEVPVYVDRSLENGPEDAETREDSCLACHGTVVTMERLRTVDTIQGEMDLPVLSGWPNQGTGRINPDGSSGACTPCHSRHAFSIAVARTPRACAKCHTGPDVPAYRVYSVSKHGTLFAAMHDRYNLQNVPWTVGKDFTAPSCAACHISLLVTGEGNVIAERTHRMNDRKAWRLFGLIYAHPEPVNADTSRIRNEEGLPLPTNLDGTPVKEHLIGKAEMKRRRSTMAGVCRACHSSAWVAGHFKRLDHTIQTTNAATLTATRIMLQAWTDGAARGIAQEDSIFNEPMEKKWVESWFFYANSTRFASAMMGADYGVFDRGRWFTSKSIQQLFQRLNQKPPPAGGKPKLNKK